MMEGVRIACEYPVQGVGPGITEKFYSGTFHEENPPPSVLNLFINVAAEVGFPALIFFVLYLIGCFFSISQRALKHKAKGYYTVELAFIFLLFIWSMLPDLRMVMFMYIVSLSGSWSPEKTACSLPSAAFASPTPKLRTIGSKVSYTHHG